MTVDIRFHHFTELYGCRWQLSILHTLQPLDRSHWTERTQQLGFPVEHQGTKTHRIVSGNHRDSSFVDVREEPS